eukprot:TRINITY_DN958_c0_g1_i1.p1 TRINITY_DN958_c0_g1~~TRINITY_DN958_c0_g1_i1.p1  ORF type:complete len:172 (+),score=24.26 TRINITY_DN958_c0_g1_i1:96-611(+)
MDGSDPFSRIERISCIVGLVVSMASLFSLINASTLQQTRKKKSITNVASWLWNTGSQASTQNTCEQLKQIENNLEESEYQSSFDECEGDEMEAVLKSKSHDNSQELLEHQQTIERLRLQVAREAELRMIAEDNARMCQSQLRKEQNNVDQLKTKIVGLEYKMNHPQDSSEH